MVRKILQPWSWLKSVQVLYKVKNAKLSSNTKSVFPSFLSFWHDNTALTFPVTSNLLSTWAVVCSCSLSSVLETALHLCRWLYGKSYVVLVKQHGQLSAKRFASIIYGAIAECFGNEDNLKKNQGQDDIVCVNFIDVTYLLLRFNTCGVFSEFMRPSC